MQPMSGAHPSLRTLASGLALAAMLAWAPLPCNAAVPAPWPAVTFSYLANNETVERVLAEFGRTFGLRVECTQGVNDHPVRLNGNITTATPDEFLNRLGISHGLQWFQHSGTLHVSLASESITRALPASGVSGIRQALTSLGVADPRFGWADLPERSTVIVSGPPAYVGLLASTLSSLPPAPMEQEVRVFRLKHATVDDRVIQYRDKEITTSGVATLLRSLMGNLAGRTGTVMQTTPAPAPLKAAAPAPSLGDSSAGAASGKADAKADAKAGGSAASADSSARTPATYTDNGSGSGSGNSAANIATIQADSRLNALVVRDRPERMPLYEQLIASLDVPSYLIQIEAMIVDISTTQARQLGVDWQAKRVIGGTAITGGVGNPDLLATASAATLAGNFLMARINALESTGEARVVSRPSVLTVDNLGALIDLSETMYLSVVGERVANIVPVAVGVTLKVTPHVIEHNGERSVQLTVDIEDGAIVDAKTRSQPTVRRSTVGTQAVMAQDQSLLIGGFRTEQDMKQHDRTPVLGDLPLVGVLFGQKDVSTSRSERMFVLTPRIIEPAVMRPLAKAP